MGRGANTGDRIDQDGRKAQYVVPGFGNTFTVHLDTGSVAAKTGFMLIDLSDTSAWPHTKTGHIIIEHLSIQTTPDSSYLGAVKMGFLSSVDGSNGDLNILFDLDLTKKSDLFAENIAYSSGLHCQAASHFGPIEANDTLWQTDVNLGGPNAPGSTTYPSGAGDLVLLVERSAGTVAVSIALGYETVD